MRGGRVPEMPGYRFLVSHEPALHALHHHVNLVLRNVASELPIVFFSKVLRCGIPAGYSYFGIDKQKDHVGFAPWVSAGIHKIVIGFPSASGRHKMWASFSTELIEEETERLTTLCSRILSFRRPTTLYIN
jgi:hypothetical protein